MLFYQRPFAVLRPRPFRFALLGLAAAVLVACSTEKDAFLNRTFHRLVTRDNFWFNANEKLKETIDAMEKAYVDDYDEVLPIFIYGTDEQSKAITPDLEACIEKCATVIDRHSMDIGGKEKNTWVDDAYFVVGKCHFYKRSYFDAERTFDYIGRRYKGEDRQLESKLWLARTAIQMEQYAKAQSALDEVKNQKELPKHFPHDQLSAIQADLDLHRGKVDDAIIDLEHAVDIAEKKKDRIRWAFILAQLYQMKGMDDKAIAQFRKVTRMNPPYEMGFHADIFQALAFDRGNSKAIRQKLGRMLRDEKNKDHFDMIHYALADLDLKEGQDSSAIAHLKRSALVSTTDTRQKAKSFLKLADLYFDDRRYPPAQQYYDSTSTLLAETNTRYDEVKTRAEVLGDLVEQLDIIAREDSLQAFAALDPDEQEKRVKRLIRAREEEEEERQRAEDEARELQANNPNPITPTPVGNTGGAWYFYSPTQLSRGLAEFKKKWGSRPNDDDWRRKDKSGSALVDAAAEEEEEPEEGGGTAAGEKEGEPAWKDPTSYLKDIPKDSLALAASNEKICSALYLSGMIYKEKLKDVDNAIESFQNLKSRFDDCRYTPEAHYQLYRIYLDKERAGNFIDFTGASSQSYADIILERWPDSEFARLVRNPDQLEADAANQRAENEAYDALYTQFKQGFYMVVITTCDGVIANQPRNHLLPKYHLLKAMAIGGLHQMSAFRDALTAVTTKFAGTDEAKAAAAILANLDRQAQRPGEPPPPEKPGNTFTVDAGVHYVVLIVPKTAGELGRITAKISDFDQQNFRNVPIEVKTSVFDADHSVVMIRMFETKEKAMTYYDLFRADRDILAGINDQGFATFAISAGNYQQFFTNKDVEGYTAFFSRNYLGGQ